MNAKDFHIQTVQEESFWLALAKKIARDEAQRLMKQGANYHTQGGSHEGIQRVKIFKTSGT